MRVIMRSTAHRYPRGRLARADQSGAERSGRSLGAREEERRKVKRSGGESEKDAAEGKAGERPGEGGG